MKAIIFLAGAVAAANSFGQVAAPTAPVTAPPATVTAPSTIPNPGSSPGSLINPAVPTAVPPQAAGRTFQSPVVSGSPAPTLFHQPTQPAARGPGFPPFSLTPTNFGLAGPFTNRLSGAAGTVGGDPVGLGFPRPLNNAFPPIANPTTEAPVVFDFPPGSVVNSTVNPANTVGTPLTPNTPGAAGRPPTVEQGSSERRPPSVVRPQR